MDREKAMLEQAFLAHKSNLKKYLEMTKKFQRVPKAAEASEAFRKAGNALYTQKPHNHHTHLQIFYNYCRAILAAPSDSEHLALSYGNRSAFLLHIKKYEDSIKDIDRALEITKTHTLKIKLLCRKAECLKKLGSLEEKDVLKEAHKYVNKLDSKSKEIYGSLVDKVKTMSINVDDSSEKERTVSETKDPSECVKIDYSKEFGRHLVAEKDYAPGDIIFVEKTYATHINPRMVFTNCDFCLKTAWSGVPCSHCSWTIFCSEECRDKAMNLYHNIECSLVPFLKLTMNELFNMTKLNLRVVIIAIKEAGSVSELMNRLKAVDKCKDMKLKGFYKNGKFNSNTIESLYSLCSDYSEPDFVFVGQAATVLMVLVGFSTQTKIMKNWSLRKIDDLVKNNELMFLGSLLMKLIMIRRNTNDALFGSYKTCELESDMNQCLATSCCTRGFYMASLTSLINHSCFPNAKRCFTDNQQIIIHAIHPIKKNQQITMAYYCHFYDTSILERKEGLKERNILDCFCKPCKNNWPPLLNMSQQQLVKLNLGMKTDLEKKLHDNCSQILAAFERNSTVKNKFDYFKINDLEELSAAVIEAFQHLKQPSYLTCLLVHSLGEVFSYVYGLKPRHFGTCEYYQNSD